MIITIDSWTLFVEIVLLGNKIPSEALCCLCFCYELSSYLS